MLNSQGFPRLIWTIMVNAGKAKDTFNKVSYVAKTSCLGTLPIDGEGLMGDARAIKLGTTRPSCARIRGP